jgi:hypothetical protein
MSVAITFQIKKASKISLLDLEINWNHLFDQVLSILKSSYGTPTQQYLHNSKGKKIHAFKYV